MFRRDAIQRRARPYPGETADEALRRLLARYYQQIVRAEVPAARGSVLGLHDLRVALRKLRNVALLFHALDPLFLTDLSRKISKVSNRMGKARDLDVWVALFHQMDAAGVLKQVTDQDRCAVEGSVLADRKRLATAALSHGLFRRVKKMVRNYVRRVPQPRDPLSLSPEAFAARQMLVVRTLIETRHQKAAGYSCDRAHSLRRAGRRMRYLVEFFAPAMGPATQRAGMWITRAQSALGKVHDCDSALALSKMLPTGTGRAAVRKVLKQRRARYLRKFKTAWRHYADRRLQKTWQTQLKAAAAS